MVGKWFYRNDVITISAYLASHISASFHIASFNRKKRYVDSLTRKYKHIPKVRNEIEIDDMFSAADSHGEGEHSASLPKNESEEADSSPKPPCEDGKWLPEL